LWGRTKKGQPYVKDSPKPITGLREPSDREKKLNELGKISVIRNTKESRFTGDRMAVEAGDPNISRTEMITKLHKDADDILALRVQEQNKIKELREMPDPDN